VLAGLRERYGGIHKLDPVQLSSTAGQVLATIAASVAPHIHAEGSNALFTELTPSDQEHVLHRMATRSVQNPQQAIEQGRFLEFAPRKSLLRFFESHPELFFDGKCWDDRYSEIAFDNQTFTDEARAQLTGYYSSLLTDAIWLAEQEPTDLAEASREKLLRAAMAVDLLSLDAQA
jgi:hypothetical protein